MRNFVLTKRPSVLREAARQQLGSSLAELAAALVIILPVLIVVIFVTLQASYAYLIKNALNDASRQAARDLAKAYELNSQIAEDRSAQETMVLSKIKIPGFVNSPAQFSVAFSESASPPNVAVTVKYQGGQWGLPTYPTLNPLNLNKPFNIACQSTYRL